MVARPAERRSSANAGELDQALAGRPDIKQYYSGGLRYKHIEPVPQSGFRDMGGTVDTGAVRPRLTELATFNVSATPGPHTGTETVWSADVSGDVAAVHVSGLVADTASHTAVVEVFAGGAWSQLGPSLPVTTTAAGKTFAAAPGKPVAGATAVRIRVTFSESASVSLDSVTVLAESGTQDWPRYAYLRHDSGDRYFLAATEKWLDIHLDDTFKAGIYLPDITTARLPELGFYTENATIGIFHRTMDRTIRVRRAGAADDWTVDDWPYEGIPTEDLGGTYPKTDDVWEVFLRWVSASEFIYLTMIVDGESTPAIALTDSGDTPVAINGGPDWAKFATDIAAAINDLPSIGSGVTVAQEDASGSARKLTITFSGALAGREYQVDAQITNTSNVSALPVHIEVGETEFEPIFSASRGFCGGAALVQDRLAYYDINAVRGALALSEAAEYFNLNIEAAGPNRARLDRLRAGQTAERILAVYDATYMLVFTDQRVHFAPNRTIKADEPLNFTKTAGTGIVPHTTPVELEEKVYYVGYNDDENDQDGHQIFSLSYDELLTKFEAPPESLLASHLVKSVMRTKEQRSSADTDAAKMWAMRRDGRLIACQVIRSEEILGLCEWICPAGGLVREIEVDARNQLRLCVERDGELRHERQDRDLFLQAVVSSTCDLAGQVDGLDVHEGREVWAVAQGYVLGPFTVASGAIDLGDHYTGTVKVGLWTAPIYESMPFYYIRRDDKIIERPGRIPVVHVNVIDTTSIAVGANGQPARDVPLLNASDPADAPMPAKTGKYTVSGLLGAKVGTTVVFTQVRPGRLRVRDYKVEEAL